MIKKFFTAIAALFLVTALNAQSFDAQKATEELASVYSLDAEQKTEMLVIQERKARNLSEIQSLKNADREMYIKKLKAVHYGTDASVKRLLNKEQMVVFYERAKDLRQRQADKMKEMKDAGFSPEDIREEIAKMD